MKNYLHSEESEKLQEEQLIELLAQIIVDNVFKKKLAHQNFCTKKIEISVKNSVTLFKFPSLNFEDD